MPNQDNETTLIYDDLNENEQQEVTIDEMETDVVLLDGEEIGDPSEPIIIEEDDEDDANELTEEEIEEARKEIEEMEVIPTVNNAEVREDYVSKEPVDEIILKLLKADKDQYRSTILPSKQVDILAKELSKAIVEARISKRKEVEETLMEVLAGIAGTADTTGVAETLFRDENAKLEQGVYNPTTGAIQGIRSVEIGSKADEIRGEVAILKAAKALELGDVVHVPLPHSGFWVTLSPPSEKELIRFYNIVSRAKTVLGRSSQGYIFGNDSVKLNRDLIRFIKRNIMATNFKDVADTDIEDKLMLNDLPILVWGFARTIYANGFPFRRLCDNRDHVDEEGNFIEGCNDIQEVNMNLDKLLWIDNNALSETQKEIFSKQRAKSITLKDYETYIAQSKFLNKESFTYKTVTIDLRQPTVKEHLEDGLAWIDDIVDELDYAVAANDYDQDEKDEMLEIFMRSSMMRNWSHYVEAIHIGKNVIKDRETIQTVLARFGTNRDFSKLFSEAIIKYRNKSVIAAIGIPEYKCPKCGTNNEGDLSAKALTNVIPLSPTNLFFLMFIIKFQMVITSTETL